jgi:hypothetical protein
MELEEYLCVEALVPEIKVIPGYLMHSAKDRAPEAEMELVYLKFEADKLIEELKAQKAQVEDDCAYWKMRHGNAANAMHETEEYAMQLYNELRHHKYKRCLAMAKICENKLGTVVKPGWWDKWRNRWLELAEKFKDKEAK